jgi:hypothetical protein
MLQFNFRNNIFHHPTLKHTHTLKDKSKTQISPWKNEKNKIIWNPHNFAETKTFLYVSWAHTKTCDAMHLCAFIEKNAAAFSRRLQLMWSEYVRENVAKKVSISIRKFSQNTHTHIDMLHPPSLRPPFVLRVCDFLWTLLQPRQSFLSSISFQLLLMMLMRNIMLRELCIFLLCA